MSSIHNAFLRGVSAALVGGAFLATPSFAGSEPGAKQLQASDQAPLEMNQSSQKDAQIAQTYIPLVGDVGQESGQGTGWYLTIGAGAAWPSDMNVRTRNFDPNFNGDATFGGGFSIDGGLGYDFGAIRTELTYGYTRASLDEVNINNSSLNFSSSGIINKNDVMASLYWDIATGSRFTPYIGGGIGYTNLSTPSITIDGFRSGSANRGLFGWQAKVGVSYATTYNTDVYLEGTYAGAGGFSSDYIQYDSYNDWGAKLGFRYRFASPEVIVVAPEPAPAPMPEPAPAPIPQPEPAPAPVRGLW